MKTIRRHAGLSAVVIAFLTIAMAHGAAAEEKIQYRLRLFQEGVGGLSLEPGTYFFWEGGFVFIEAFYTDPGWYFLEWRGDLEGVYRFGGQRSYTVDRDREITAVFCGMAQVDPNNQCGGRRHHRPTSRRTYLY